MYVLANRPGQVTVVRTPGDQGMPIAVAGALGSWFPRFRAILTGVTVALDGNFQFQHTLRDVIYVYVFGDRISQLRIEGLAFAAGCPDGGPSGIEMIMEAYQGNRIAARPDPLQLAIGVGPAGRFRGYMTGFRADIVKPEARIAQFSFTFHVFPGAG